MNIRKYILFFLVGIFWVASQSFADEQKCEWRQGKYWNQRATYKKRLALHKIIDKS